MEINLKTPIENIGGVGKTTASRLKRVGLENAEDLLFYFPSRHEDFRNIVKIADLKTDQQATVLGKIEQISSRRSWKRKKMTIIEAVISDETGQIKLLWFNQYYIPKVLSQGDEIYVSGKAMVSRYGLQISNPTFEKAQNIGQIHTAGLIPIYPTTYNLSQKQIRYLIKTVLPLAAQIEDFLPDDVKKGCSLIGLQEAIKSIHFPQKEEGFKKAKKRLTFDELFLIQLTTLKSKKELDSQKAYSINFKEKEIKEFVKKLPFTLTDSQRKSAWEIIKNLEHDHPMNRLLEGDVGSGKTIVAALAMLNSALNGFQVALMVPTEILAWQHFLQISELFKKQHLHIAALTTSLHHVSRGINKPRKINRKRIIDEMQEGKMNIVIGTHALIQEKIKFDKLALAIIDEQHRFGVDQRKKLVDKSGDIDTTPHLLSMTATPIPRSLSLTIYGDLDLSIINELPEGRKQIITKVVETKDREKSYEFIREKVKQGEQVFVICPLIEESDKLGYKSVKQEYEKLSKEVFPELEIALLHGKLGADEKEKIMQNFKDNKTNILISTSVVEVGVDIPNATIMLIESAERFGLAQLHQFRGRVGRGEKQSHCLLFSESENETTKKRLDALVKSTDGFELAQKDLELRGPGEVYGTKQSGIPTLKLASLLDMPLVKKTRDWALKTLDHDPSLDDYPKLKEKVLNNLKRIHFE